MRLPRNFVRSCNLLVKKAKFLYFAVSAGATAAKIKFGHPHRALQGFIVLFGFDKLSRHKTTLCALPIPCPKGIYL